MISQENGFYISLWFLHIIYDTQLLEKKSDINNSEAKRILQETANILDSPLEHNEKMAQAAYNLSNAFNIK